MAKNKVYKFEAEIKRVANKNFAFVEFPYSVLDEFGIKGRVAVKARIDGFVNRGSLVKMDHHCHTLGLRKEIREAIEKGFGDIVEVVLEKDDEPRVVKLPKYMQIVLDEHPTCKSYFEGLSFTNQREYFEWVDGAKKEETTKRRMGKMIEMLSEEIKHP